MLPDANDLTLVRNEIIHIKDIESGFIKSHHDHHRPLTSNPLEESPLVYTALICVTPTRESTTQVNQGVYAAAQTVYTHGEEIKLTAATAPGAVLLFKKVCSRSPGRTSLSASPQVDDLEALKFVAGEMLSLSLRAITKQVTCGGPPISCYSR